MALLWRRTEGAYLSEATIELCKLANQNDVRGMRAMIAAAASTKLDINARDMLGRTALHIATLGGHVAAAQVCVDVGSSLCVVCTMVRCVQ